MSKAVDRPLTIGWKEHVDFLDWGLKRVKAKVDTGARTSALDAVSYELRPSDAGLIAELRLALDRRHPERLTTVQTPVLALIAVTNTSGVREERPVVEATLRLGPVRKRVRLTLTSRAGMRFPMILGRTALQGDFIVDVQRKYLLRKLA
jgi:hypothetical protein